MSTLAIEPARQDTYGVWDLVGSEWIKLRSVRSTMWSLFATVALVLGIAALATATEASRWNSLSLAERLTFDPTALSLTGLLFGQLAIGVLGVLVMSAEYSTGTIRATFSAAPRRWQVLLAKALVFGLVAFVVSEAVSFGAFFLGQAILGRGIPHANLGLPGVARAVVGGGLYLTVLSELALGLATIIRHTAGAITAYVAVLLVLPLIVAALPSSIQDAVGRYLPANIGAALISTNGVVHRAVGGSVFSPWVGFGILCGYGLAALMLGGWLLVRRDA